MEPLVADLTFQKYLQDIPPKFFTDHSLANPFEHNNSTIRLEAVVKTADIPGDIVQCGVYRGASIGTLALLAKKIGVSKKIWGLDSFEGLPVASKHDTVKGVLAEKSTQEYWADTDVRRVEQLMKDIGVAESVRFIQGFYQETLPHSPVATIALLILDCDLYQSYRECLQFLYPKVSPEGIIIFDEYYSPPYPGARKAIDEFLADKPEKPILAKQYLQYHPYERWYMVKQLAI